MITVERNLGSFAAGKCSTPEGIETVITKASSRSEGAELVLNARGHRDGDHLLSRYRRGPFVRLCSTPEGIETVITCSGPSWRVTTEAVLNARGHRDGDHTWQQTLQIRRTECSTPEGIETVITGRAM